MLSPFALADLPLHLRNAADTAGAVIDSYLAQTPDPPPDPSSTRVLFFRFFGFGRLDKAPASSGVPPLRVD